MLTVQDAATQLLKMLESGIPAAIVSVLSDYPGVRIGSRIVVTATDVVGDFGNATDAAVAFGRNALRDGSPVVDELNIGDSRVRLFADPHYPRPALVIVGAGHISVPLAEVGMSLDFRVTVLDDRDEFADALRFPAAVVVRRIDFSEPFRGIAIDANTCIVLVTRAHRYDYDCLRVLLDAQEAPRYIGMIGSRRRVKAAFQALQREGVTREKLSVVHAPIGLDIGAETPAEIAISIAAELIAVLRGREAGTLQTRERVLDRLMKDDQ